MQAAKIPFQRMSCTPILDLTPRICSMAAAAIRHHMTSTGKARRAWMANRKILNPWPMGKWFRIFPPHRAGKVLSDTTSQIFSHVSEPFEGTEFSQDTCFREALVH